MSWPPTRALALVVVVLALQVLLPSPFFAAAARGGGWNGTARRVSLGLGQAGTFALLRKREVGLVFPLGVRAGILGHF